MVAWMLKHRITHWVGRSFVVLSLAASFGAQAAMEYVAPLPPVYWMTVSWAGTNNNFEYATLDEACDGYAGLRASPLFKITVIESNSIGTLSNVSCKDLNKGDFHAEVVSFMHCPKPTIYTYIPYGLNWHIGMCERWVPVTLTITLSGGTEVEPTNGSDKKFLPIIATVLDQSTNKPLTNPVKVHVSLKVDPTSGGHDHGDSTRPRGGIANVETCASDGECWSNPTVNGVVDFKFRAPEASGKYTITATCDGCSNTATKPVDVKVNGLEPIPAFPYYALEESDPDHPGQTKVIGATDLHGKNHYLTHAAAQRLMMIAIQYRTHPKFRVLDRKTKTKVPPPLLHVNDASLEWGGKFDTKGKWTGSHAEHRRGTSVDLRANENVGAIPPELFEEFEQLLGEIIAGDAVEDKFIRECTPNEKPSTSNPNPVQHNRTRENYCVSQVDGSFDTNRHYHVRLLGE